LTPPSTLRDLLHIYSQDELLEQFKRISPTSYQEFIGILYSDLDQLIGLVESDAKDFIDALEDELNRELVRLLRARFYNASHDHDEGGHVDVHVRSRDGRYSWLAEAKIDRGPEYILGGLNQLIDRYAKGTPDHHCGSVIVYIQKDRCTDRFAAWRSHLAANSGTFEEFSEEDCTVRRGLSFYTEFVLPRIGAGAPKYRVRHIGVSIFRPASNDSH
jgi:hypothetical protein